MKNETEEERFERLVEETFDDYGIEKTYVYEFYTAYYYNGRKYGNTIYAKDIQEAEEMLKVKKATEEITGSNPDKKHLHF